jgi:Family of unknown function (DUF5518)
MKQDTRNFLLGVITGLIVMFLVALVTVNLLGLIPLISPLIGGLVAGYITRKDVMNGGRAGITMGVLGAIVISLDFLIRTGYLQGLANAFRFIGADIFIFGVIIYFGILGFIGGAIGGYLRCGYLFCPAPSSE